MPPREYSSVVREESKRNTRDSILDALVRVVVDEGVHAFTIANVAKRAGVSQRTIYRHFASREELLEGVTDSIDLGGPPPAGGAEMVMADPAATVEGLFAALEDRREFAIAESIVATALGHLPRAKRVRWAGLQALVEQRFPALDADEQLAGAAAIRALGASNTWFHLCVQLGIPAGPAARGIGRALELVLADLEQRNTQRGDTHG